LGGLLWFTDTDTHKESLRRFRDALIARCTYTGVAIMLNTEATRETIESMKPDAVICAVGSQPRIPAIKGIEKAAHALDAYRDLSIPGREVVIIGGGAIGCESGYFFTEHWGAKVRILEMRDDICKDSNDSQRRALIPRMRQVGMIWDCGVTVKEVTDQVVLYLDRDGNEQFAGADKVIYAAGNIANTDIVKSLEGACPVFVVTGDAKRARTVRQATYEGFCAAMDII